MAPFAPPSHLDWPFFEPRHRAFAAELGAWADAHLAHDHGPDVAGCAGVSVSRSITST